MQYSVTFCSQLEAANDVISDLFVGLIVMDKDVKFRDHSLNCSRDIQPQTGIFSRFSRGSYRQEAASDVISSVTVDYVGVDVRVTFGDSRSSRS